MFEDFINGLLPNGGYLDGKGFPIYSDGEVIIRP